MLGGPSNGQEPGHKEEVPCAVTEHWNESREGLESPSQDIPEPSGPTPELWDDPDDSVVPSQLNQTGIL